MDLATRQPDPLRKYQKEVGIDVQRPSRQYYQYHWKNPEPPQSEIMEIGMDDIFNTSNSKNIDIASYTLCEGLIKSQTISENILEPVFVRTENIIKTEDTNDDNGQEVLEIQETNEEHVLNFSNDLNGIGVTSPKSEHPEKTDFAECYRTDETTSSEQVKAKIKVIREPVIPVKSHEYTTLAKNKHACNHCQRTRNTLNNLKSHIMKMHREVTTTYQCSYCSYKSKLRSSVRLHIHTRDHLNVTIKNIPIEMNSGFITQLEPPILSNHWKNPEPPESQNMKICMDDIFNTSDAKDMDIVSHKLCEGLIKSETILENILETVFVKTENVKIENIIESENLIKTEDTSDDNGQEVVEVQGNLETDEQQVLNFSNDLNGIRVRSPKSEYPETTDFAECYRTRETTSSEEVKASIKVIEAPVIPVKSHEYITLAKNKHVCNHCQLTCKTFYALKFHIRTKHREVTTMYQCLYCSFKSKWKSSLPSHIFYKHESTRDTLKYHCNKCDFKTYQNGHLQSHKLNHLKPEEIQYFYCHHCSYKSKYNHHLKYHVLRHLENEQNLKGYRCDKCNYKTYNYPHLKSHKRIHLKPEEIQYFHCYHCSYKYKHKSSLKTHILRHYQREEIKFDCFVCDFMTLKRDMIIRHLRKHFKHHTKSDEAKRKYQLETHTKIRYYYCDTCDYKTFTHQSLNVHKLNHLKPEEIPYFYCYHCSYKSKHKYWLRIHIFRHFEREEIKFHCYICDFMTLERHVIIKHLKKHFKHHTKSDEATCKYQLENHIGIRYYYCDTCDYKTYIPQNLNVHKLNHLKPEEIPYFYCYHCSFKSKHKYWLRIHIFRHFEKEEIKFHCYICDFMTLKRHVIIKHLKKHFKHHTESVEVTRKYQLENHTGIRYHYCDKCDYKSYARQHLNRHKIIHLKPEEIQYFYCYHCSHKAKRKSELKAHIFRHFKNGVVPFHCYICDFMTFKRELIIGHIKKKHSKVQINSEINEGS